MTQQKVALAVVGEGAIARKHLAALSGIDQADVVRLVGADPTETERVADASGLPAWSTSYDETLADDRIDAVLLATPTPLHAEQTIAALDAGKHVLVEIPMADSLEDSRRVVAAAAATDRVAMVGHTRRF
ncbi:MAG: Gfo/Idh/MocA family protein, partial [Acidimicrobiales bacterium]